MPTLEEVKKIRAEFDGREMHTRFFEYCESHGVIANEDTFIQWDEKHNGSRFRKYTEGKVDLAMVGLREMARRFLVNYSPKIQNGPIVMLPSGKKYQPIVHGTRMVAGSRVRLEKITAKQVNVIREQFRVEVRQLLRTQKFFNLPAGEIRAIVLEELESIEQEKN